MSTTISWICEPAKALLVAFEMPAKKGYPHIECLIHRIGAVINRFDEMGTIFDTKNKHEIGAFSIKRIQERLKNPASVNCGV